MKFGYSRGEPTSNPSLNLTPESRLRRLSAAGWLDQALAPKRCQRSGASISAPFHSSGTSAPAPPTQWEDTTA